MHLPCLDLYKLGTFCDDVNDVVEFMKLVKSCEVQKQLEDDDRTNLHCWTSATALMAVSPPTRVCHKLASRLHLHPTTTKPCCPSGLLQVRSLLSFQLCQP